MLDPADGAGQGSGRRNSGSNTKCPTHQRRDGARDDNWPVGNGALERVAIVTGAARGIGAAISKRLAADGRAVAVLDLEEDATQETVEAVHSAGGRAIGVGADVADADQVATAVDRVAAELGPPTILVNNAGILKDNLLFKMTDDDWDSVVAVHLRGASSRCTCGARS
jgi:NAD(P)-dependent dehydrogenase (short-subunit alcohol dehydrogenase family)